MEYNSKRGDLVMPEYGRHIQKMVDHTKGLEDKEERNEAAKAVIKLMGQLNPHLRDVEEFKQKLWDHLYVMADFDLDVESPYPMPKKEGYMRPEQLAYPTGMPRFKHYGLVIHGYIEAAVKMADGEEKEALTLSIANMMKKAYLNWNRDSVDDKLIKDQLFEMSDGNLKLAEEVELAHIKVVNQSRSQSNFRKKGKSKKPKRRTA